MHPLTVVGLPTGSGNQLLLFSVPRFLLSLFWEVSLGQLQLLHVWILQCLLVFSVPSGLCYFENLLVALGVLPFFHPFLPDQYLSNLLHISPLIYKELPHHPHMFYVRWMFTRRVLY